MRSTLRAVSEQRWTTVAFAVAAFAMTLLQSVAFYRLAGHTFADRAAFGYSLSLDAVASADLLPPPIQPQTVAGYLQIRAFEPLAILFAAWAMVSATTYGSHRIVARAGAFAMSAAAATAAACAGVFVGVSSSGESIGVLRVVEAGLMLVALAIACHAICLVVAQVAPSPTVVAGALLLTLFFLNSLSRVFTQLAVARWLSPFRYYDLSMPLPAGGRFDLGGFAVLLAIALVGTAVATVIPVKVSKSGRVTYVPSRMRLLGVPVLRILYPKRIAMAAWSIAFTALGAVLVLAARSSMQDLLNFPSGLPGLGHYIFVFLADLLDQSWFRVMILLFAALDFAFVWGWADDDRSGRLEAALSAPYSRPVALLERLAALGLVTAVLAALGGLAVDVTSRALNLSLDGTRLVEACVVLFLFAVVLGAVGLLLTSSVSGAASILFGSVVLGAYLDDQIGKALTWPAWAQGISPFRLAGAPLVDGVDGRSLALFVLLTLAVFGSSILAFRRHDVGGRSPTRSSQAPT